MYSLINEVGVRKALLAEAPPAALSLVIAEFFYKFHSFTLECLCFLATWLAVSSLFALAQRLWPARREVAV